ncbi:MAG: hypothetical protein ACQER9_02480 [Nanobdellota archaeon]
MIGNFGKFKEEKRKYLELGELEKEISSMDTTIIVKDLNSSIEASGLYCK